MAGQIVSATTGAMNPLLGKLATLMGDEYKKLKRVRKRVSFLKDELSTIKALLDKLELMDELDPLAKNWRDHVREMSYDMENCIDDFMRSLGGADAKEGFFKKTARRLNTLLKRHRIADRIEELKTLAVEANERRMRYKLDDCINSTSSGVAVDPRMVAIYQEAAGLVGIDGPREELVSWLTDTEKNVKVVSIVGFGGLGKTTLARHVYDKIGGQFDCKAFVSVSQRPDMTRLLSALQSKLGIEESPGAPKPQYIISRLWEHLIDKRYLIVVDDLWDESTWQFISCAFPEGGNGSRVIVTTRVDDVALWACRNDRECLYRMKPLEEQDSRRLFFNRVFGYEDGCPPQFKEVSVEILKKCGGLPLAIITIASLLASHQARSKDEWESISNSLGAKFATNPTLKEMRSILNLSYIHLPLHLRTCLLYLGMYPEDKEIQRDDLVRQWVAEGFVNQLHGSDLEDAAKSYFNELINRSLIQPEKTSYGEVSSCRVHGMMLDLILSKCQEDNFISVAYNYEDMPRLHDREHKVRRLLLNSSVGGAESGTIATSLSQVRSFAQFGECKYTPPLLLFKYLRVLVFEFQGTSDKTLDLTYIGQLFQLRYLKISAYLRSILLPTEIQGLVYLETLEIYGKLAQGIPSDIVHLPCLSRLILSYRGGLPDGIGNMKSLRTLYCFGTEKCSPEDIKGLGELTNLRELFLDWSYGCRIAAAEVLDALVPSIGKLHDLEYLNLNCEPPKNYDDQLYSLSNPSLHIELLYLTYWPFKRVPKWIGDLHCLRRLLLCVERLSTEMVHVLGKLPSLVVLYLDVLHIPKDSAAIISTGLFPVLEHLGLCSTYDGDVTACMRFEAGAMSKLRRLDLVIAKRWGGATPVGMERLSGLQQIYLDTHTIDSAQLRRDAESLFGNAAQVLPSRPSVIIKHSQHGVVRPLPQQVPYFVLNTTQHSQHGVVRPLPQQEDGVTNFHSLIIQS